jgi:hypothetical protein
MRLLKPPNPAQRQQLVVRLEAELRRAEWSAGEEREKEAELRSKIDRTEAAKRAQLNGAKPKKKKKLEEHGESAEDDTLLKGGRVDAATRRPPRDRTLLVRVPRRLQEQLTAFKGSKQMNATPDGKGGITKTVPRTKEPTREGAPVTARRSTRLAGATRR